MRHKFTRQELKNKSVRQFKEGDVIVCNNYFIWIKYGKYSLPSLLTVVSTKYDMRDMRMHKQPQYIRDFIDRGLDEIKEEKSIIEEINWNELKRRLNDPQEQEKSMERINSGLASYGLSI